MMTASELPELFELPELLEPLDDDDELA